MNNTDLNTLIDTNVTSGNRDTTAAEVREVLKAIVSSFQNIDGKNAANGYVGLNGSSLITQAILLASLAVVSPTGKVLKDTGSFESIDLVKTTASNIDMNDGTYARVKHFIYTGSGGTWTAPLITGDRLYTILNAGSGTLTLNYSGGQNKLVDIPNSLSPVNTLNISALSSIKLVDDGSLMYSY